ncbi:MAG: hypothetical protein ACOX6V_00520 [Patescibacteria group bacterium]|jgi:hypothetical protein
MKKKTNYISKDAEFIILLLLGIFILIATTASGFWASHSLVSRENRIKNPEILFQTLAQLETAN